MVLSTGTVTSRRQTDRDETETDRQAEKPNQILNTNRLNYCPLQKNGQAGVMVCTAIQPVLAKVRSFTHVGQTREVSAARQEKASLCAMQSHTAVQQPVIREGIEQTGQGERSFFQIRERPRQTGTQADRRQVNGERVRQVQRCRKRDGGGVGVGGTEGEREGMEREGERERGMERARERQRKTETETERQRQRWRQRQTETDRQTETETETEAETETETERLCCCN